MSLGLGHHRRMPDIVRYARHHYTPPKDDPLSLTPRVAVRTAEDYATLPDNRDRAATARRREENLTRGHFSDQNKPYVTVGDVCLEPQTLFCKTLGVKLPPKEHHVTIQTPLTEHTPAEKTTKDLSKSASTDQDGSPGEDGAVCGELREAAGLTAIWSHLRETTSRRAAMRAGQSYLDHIKLCQKAAAKDDSPQDSMNMVVQKISSHHFLSSKDRKYTLAFDPETMTLKVKPKQNLALVRKQRHFVQRIETIYNAIISLGNLKSKHLRRRNPLSPEELKALQKPPVVIEGKQGSPSTTMDSGIRASNTHSLEPTSSNKSFQGSSKASVHFRPQRRGIGGFGLNQPRKDTWEEMILDGKAKTKRRPWQSHLHNMDRASSIRGAQHSLEGLRRTSREQCDVMTAVEKQKQTFQSLQDKLVKQTQDRLNKHSRDRSATYNLKLTSLCDLHPLWEIKGREVAQISAKPQDSGILPEETETWFVQLTKDLAELDEPTLPMLVRMDQLKRFAFGSGLNFTNVKEKLCLLTVSLPIQEICNPVVRDAMQFVVEEIFSLPRDLVHQWLTFRNLNFDKEN